jgi:hypothetical protein
MKLWGRALVMFGIVVLGSRQLHAEVIAHFPLDEGFEFEGSNATVDTTGGRIGTVGAGISFVPGGPFGNAASFTGQGGIQFPYDAGLNPDSSFTLTAWVNPKDTTSWNSVVTSREDSGTVNGYILYNSPENQWDFWTGAGGPAGAWGRNIGPAATLDTWTHLAIAYDKPTDTKTLYVNGVAEAVVAGQGFTPNGTGGQPRPFNIGAGQDMGDGFFFNGLIDDVGLFDTALTAAEVQNVATNGVVVPEPASVGLLLLGGLTLLGLRRRV